MTNRIKTTISSNSNIFDINGQWLPKGNYYFCVDEFSETTAKGELTERSFNANYEFKLADLVKMMSIAQARLARRANIVDTHMPSCASPSISPITTPNELRFRTIINNYVDDSEDEEPICTICLEKITDNDNHILECNHSFHSICINRWLSANTNCPVCRRYIRNRDNIRLPNIRVNNNNQSRRNIEPIPPAEINRTSAYRRRVIRTSNVRIAPVISRNNPIIRLRTPVRRENINRPVSSSRQREYDRIYSSGNSLLR